MDLTYSAEEEQVRETLRDFLESKDGIEPARRMMAGEEEVVDELWDELSGMDYMALTVPFDQMGLGEDILYLSLVLEEIGRYAMPGPYAETMAFAVPLIEEAGTEDQMETCLTDIADGDRKMSFALYDSGTDSLPEDIQLTAEESADGYRLDGTKTLVPYGGLVDTLIVAARTQDGQGTAGVSLFLVDTDEVETQRLESLDQTQPMYDVTLNDLHLPEEALLGEANEGWEPLSGAIDRFRVAMCAMQVGAAERAIENSAEYGNTREQFGQPIGRFQGVKHRIADMWMGMRSGRSLVYYAAWALANDEDDARRAVSTAKAHCAEQSLDIFDGDIQVHGGTGFTWDHDGHIYLKQAKAWENFLGSPRDHRERICEMRGL